MSKDALLEMIKALRRASPICHNWSQARIFPDFAVKCSMYISQVLRYIGYGWSRDIGKCHTSEESHRHPGEQVNLDAGERNCSIDAQCTCLVSNPAKHPITFTHKESNSKKPRPFQPGYTSNTQRLRSWI